MHNKLERDSHIWSYICVRYQERSSSLIEIDVKYYTTMHSNAEDMSDAKEKCRLDLKRQMDRK